MPVKVPRAVRRFLRMKNPAVAPVVSPIRPVTAEDENSSSSSQEEDWELVTSSTSRPVSVGSVTPSSVGTLDKSFCLGVDEERSFLASWSPNKFANELLGPANFEKTFQRIGISPRKSSAFISPLLLSSPDSCAEPEKLPVTPTRIDVAFLAEFRGVNTTYNCLPSSEAEQDVTLFSKSMPNPGRVLPVTPKSSRENSKLQSRGNKPVLEKKLSRKRMTLSPAMVQLTKFTSKVSPNILAEKIAASIRHGIRS